MARGVHDLADGAICPFVLVYQPQNINKSIVSSASDTGT